MAEKMTFEKAWEKLEKVVNDLESGDVALETALKKYEEGIKLARYCQGHLTEAEKTIALLNRRADGNFEIKDFDTDDEPVAKKKTTARKKKEDDSDDEDFLL